MSIVYILLSLCVALDDTSAYYLTTCCMTTLLLLDFMLPSDVGLTYIPSSRSTICLLLLCWMFDWILVTHCLLFDQATD